MLDQDKNFWKILDPSSKEEEEKGGTKEILPESQGHEPFKHNSGSSADGAKPDDVRTTTFSFIKLGKLNKEETGGDEGQPIVRDNANLEEEEMGDFKGNFEVQKDIETNMKKESLMSTFSEPPSNSGITIKNINSNGPPSSSTK